eukprot:gene10457-6480_t
MPDYESAGAPPHQPSMEDEGVGGDVVAMLTRGGVAADELRAAIRPGAHAAGGRVEELELRRPAGAPAGFSLDDTMRLGNGAAVTVARGFELKGKVVSDPDGAGDLLVAFEGRDKADWVLKRYADCLRIEDAPGAAGEEEWEEEEGEEEWETESEESEEDDERWAGTGTRSSELAREIAAACEQADALPAGEDSYAAAGWELSEPTEPEPSPWLVVSPAAAAPLLAGGGVVDSLALPPSPPFPAGAVVALCDSGAAAAACARRVRSAALRSGAAAPVRMIAKQAMRRSGIPAGAPPVFESCEIRFSIVPLEVSDPDRPGMLVRLEGSEQDIGVAGACRLQEEEDGKTTMLVTLPETFTQSLADWRAKQGLQACRRGDDDAAIPQSAPPQGDPADEDAAGGDGQLDDGEQEEEGIPYDSEEEDKKEPPCRFRVGDLVRFRDKAIGGYGYDMPWLGPARVEAITRGRPLIRVSATEELWQWDEVVLHEDARLECTHCGARSIETLTTTRCPQCGAAFVKVKKERVEQPERSAWATLAPIPSWTTETDMRYFMEQEGFEHAAEKFVHIHSNRKVNWSRWMDAPSADSLIYAQQLQEAPNLDVNSDAAGFAWVKAKVNAKIWAKDAWDRKDGLWVMFDDEAREAMNFPKGMTSLAVRHATALAARHATALAVRHATALAVRHATALAARRATALAVRHATALAVRHATALAVRHATALAVRHATALA